MPRRRLGVALLLPEAAAAEVNALRRALRDPAYGRIGPHLTLVPPVNVVEERVDEARDVLRRAAAAASPLPVTLGPPTTFMPDNPVVYLPVQGDAAELRALRDAVFVAPLERTLTWPFVPHVTLADGIDAGRITAAVDALRDYTVDVTLGRLHLLEETGGRVWETIDEFSLGPPHVIGRGGQPIELDVHADGDRVVIRARRAGQDAGRATGHVRGTVAFLDELSVGREHLGDGVGGHLLAAFDSWAAGAGTTTTELL